MRVPSHRRILIVDDELQILTFLDDLFRTEGWEVQTADSGSSGIDRLEERRFDIVLTDLKMPGSDGIEVLRTARKLQSDTEVIMMTGYGTVDTAIEAMRAGAFHYLAKPFKAEEVLHLVDKAYTQRCSVSPTRNHRCCWSGRGARGDPSSRAYCIFTVPAPRVFSSRCTAREPARRAWRGISSGTPREPTRRRCFPARGKSR